MRTVRIMLKKELFENHKKSRFVVLGVVFLLFGIMSPLTAKYIHEIIDFIMGMSGDVVEFPMEIPEPSIGDSYVQYYQNMMQMGILAQILVFIGIVSDEKSKGSAGLVLTKSVSRSVFLVSKMISSLITLFITMIPSYAAFYYYTYLLFDEFPSGTAFYGLGVYILFAVFILALTIFASTVASKMVISGLIAIGGYIFMGIMSAVPVISEYFPTKLGEASYLISMGATDVSDYLKSIVVTVVLTAVLLFSCFAVFKKQEI